MYFPLLSDHYMISDIMKSKCIENIKQKDSKYLNPHKVWNFFLNTFIKRLVLQLNSLTWFGLT